MTPKVHGRIPKLCLHNASEGVGKKGEEKEEDRRVRIWKVRQLEK